MAIDLNMEMNSSPCVSVSVFCGSIHPVQPHANNDFIILFTMSLDFLFLLLKNTANGETLLWVSCSPLQENSLLLSVSRSTCVACDIKHAVVVFLLFFF